MNELGIADKKLKMKKQNLKKLWKLLHECAFKAYIKLATFDFKG